MRVKALPPYVTVLTRLVAKGESDIVETPTIRIRFAPVPTVWDQLRGELPEDVELLAARSNVTVWPWALAVGGKKGLGMRKQISNEKLIMIETRRAPRRDKEPLLVIAYAPGWNSKAWRLSATGIWGGCFVRVRRQVVVAKLFASRDLSRATRSPTRSLCKSSDVFALQS